MPKQTRSEKSLAEIDLDALIAKHPGKFHPSPDAWEDEVLYFLMLDRFSDGREKDYLGNDGKPRAAGTTPLFGPAENGNAVGTAADAAAWRDAGGGWVGGTLKGLESKLGYLARMGVTALWISPIFRQVDVMNTYHGYGIQNYLDVDPHFGAREDLRALVKSAHAHGIRVVLDIILNHAGNVFSYVYNPDRYPAKDADGAVVRDGQGKIVMDARWDGNPYPVEGFNDAAGNPTLPFGPGPLAQAWEAGAIWPQEFQDPQHFTQKGRIVGWDYDPEYLEGDFENLKDIHLGEGDIDAYRPSEALKHLCRVYMFWIAYADLDGFRVDTVKHMDKGASRYFTSVIHEFAQKLGKERFYLIAEITGGRTNAFETLEQIGMDAALGIDDIPGKLEGLVKGFSPPEDYFGLFRNSILVGKESHTWFRDKVVTVLDDHDQVRKGNQKARFCALDPRWPMLAANALAVMALTLGIPCIYYGTEQEFDGEGGNDRYLREAMFGGSFGAFRSKGFHCFDETGRTWKRAAEILKLRRQVLALRRGRQYLRQISGNGIDFGYPRPMGDGRMLSIIPWSRMVAGEEVLCAINTDTDSARSAWVIVDRESHRDGDALQRLYASDGSAGPAQVMVAGKGGAAVVYLTVPAAGCVVYR
jgi:glycosidase